MTINKTRMFIYEQIGLVPDGGGTWHRCTTCDVEVKTVTLFRRLWGGRRWLPSARGLFDNNHWEDTHVE
jgi:hypothetical protein